MKNIIGRPLLAGLGLLILVFASTNASAVIIGFAPSSQTAMPGDTVSLNLVVSDFGDGIGDFDLDIAFDDTALDFLGYSLGAGLGDISAFEAIDFSWGVLGLGSINLSEVSLLTPVELLALQGEPLTLATLDFEVDVLALGSSTTVSIDTVWAIGDEFGLPLDVSALNDGVIRNPDVNNVPEPPILALMALGLLGIGVFSRRASDKA